MSNLKIASIKLVSGEEVICTLLDITKDGHYHHYHPEFFERVISIHCTYDIDFYEFFGAFIMCI